MFCATSDSLDKGTRNVDKPRRRIMLVDDEERLLVTTSRLFETLGVEVVTATNGQSALALLGEREVDVVFLDVKMPDMDGLKTLAEIKKWHPLVEVILLSGNPNLEDVVEGLRLGALDYLQKPASIKDLLSKAEEAFERRRKCEEKIRSALCGRGLSESK